MKNIFLSSFASLLISSSAFAAQIFLSGADYVPLLDQTGRSCALQVTSRNTGADDLPGIKALVGTINLDWTGPGTLFLDSMTVSFMGPQFPNGRQDVVISGEELGFMWAGDSVVPSFPARSYTANSPFCKFTVGGLNVKDKYEYFESTGLVKIVGRYQEQGVWSEVSGSLLFRFHMSPMPRPKN